MKKRLSWALALLILLPSASWPAVFESGRAPEPKIEGAAPAAASVSQTGTPAALSSLPADFSAPLDSLAPPAASSIAQAGTKAAAAPVQAAAGSVRAAAAATRKAARPTQPAASTSAKITAAKSFSGARTAARKKKAAGTGLRSAAETTTAIVHPGSRLEKVLHQRFAELEHAFDDSRDEAFEGNSRVPAPQRAAIIGRLHKSLHAQLDAMRHLEPEDKPILSQVRAEGDELFGQINHLMAAGEVDPRVSLRASSRGKAHAPAAREIRVGVYPVAADPFQWGHLLIALRAVAAFRLDKIVFILAGDDPRKPDMTKADFRHPMGKAVLRHFAPFFSYSSIAMGTNYDGETNLFRLLRLNARQRLQAFYLVGGDHYRLKDKNGNPDTLPKIERNLKDPALGFDGARHAVRAAFIKREGAEEHVPTALPVHFLPPVPFEASSTLVRSGTHALMPYAAYRYVQRRRPGLYGIPAPGTH